MDPSNQLPGSFKRRIIIDDDSDSSGDDTTSSSEFQLQSKAKTTTKDNNSDNVVPPISSFGSNKSAPSAGQRRKHSIGSILSDSSGELEELFQKTSISKKLLSKPPIEININCYDSSSDEESSESKNKRNPALKKTSTTTCNKDDNDDENDPESAWCRKEGSNDFYLSPQKRPDVDWPNLYLPGPLYKQLYSFQRVGVQWMATLHAKGIGGILGDDMGMGKTYVTLSYLGGLMRAGTIRNALVIAPLSVLRSWETTGRKILRQCVPSFRVTVVNSEMSRKRRLEFISSLTKYGQHYSEYIRTSRQGIYANDVFSFVLQENQEWENARLQSCHYNIRPCSFCHSRLCIGNQNYMALCCFRRRAYNKESRCRG